MQTEARSNAPLLSHIFAQPPFLAALGPDAAKRLASADPSKALASLLSTAAAACQDALVRGAAGGAAQPQALIQAYARLQQLRAAAGALDAAAPAPGAAAAAGAGSPAPSLQLPPGAPAALEASAKVLAAVEALTAAPMPADAAGVAKTEQVGAVPVAVAVQQLVGLCGCIMDARVVVL